MPGRLSWMMETEMSGMKEYREGIHMKLALVGATGNLGSRIAKMAIARGDSLKCFCRHGEVQGEQVESVKKSLFDMTEEDLQDCDVFISAYGSGFQADARINYNAFLKYIELNKTAKRPTIVIGGAGILYADEARLDYLYNKPEYPEFLYEMSKDIADGVRELEKEDFPWTVVNPPEVLEGEVSGEINYHIIATDCLAYNKNGKSYATYDDVAAAMLAIAHERGYEKQKVVVVNEA